MSTTQPPIAEQIAGWVAGLEAADIPQPVRETLSRIGIDALGIMVSARQEDFVSATVRSGDASGPCTIVGHAGGFDPQTAALSNGTAVHGEDFDDTFEGTPVHVSSIMMPAMMAAAQVRNLSGEDFLRGYAAGAELMCRMILVAPTAIHRQGFHPTAICGAFGAALGVATALRLPKEQIASAMGIVGSFASGIIEYLAEGTWTKRMHPGWAASAGWRAARMAESGFLGPRTVFEGEHGAFFAFASSKIDRDYSHLTDGWGEKWGAANLALKPYACGTMNQPYIDCALKARAQIDDLKAIQSMRVKVGEGIVHRLCEPVAEKATPSTPYGAKFSVNYCVAVALVDGDAGLAQFTEERINDPLVLDLSKKVGYEIDPDNEYPKNYTGDLDVTMADGSVVTTRQPCLRGGRQEPLSDDELVSKFMANTRFGGWGDEDAEALLAFGRKMFELPDLGALTQFAK